MYLLGGTFDPGYSAEVTIPGEGEHRVLFNVSFLGPCYAIHDKGFAGEAAHVRALAGEIEAMYRYAPIPPEIGTVIVPDVSRDAVPLGEATIYDMLLSDFWRY
ncbi:hypothetical protein A7982_13177 [Minicystis rosea]|nr:hypothetical protein A7982_13177 [Minicystis rosea]